MIKLEPFASFVWIEKDPVVDLVTESGFIIPVSCQDPPMMGTVLAVGPGSIDEEGKRVPMETSPGDRVLFPRHRGTNAIIEGKEYFLIVEKEIFATVSVE